MGTGHPVIEHLPHHRIKPPPVGAVASPPSRVRSLAQRPRRYAPTPTWTLLYALLPLCAVLFALVDYVPWSAGLRTLAEGAVVILLIGLSLAWVRANRRALSGSPSDSEAAETGPPDIRVEVHHPSPRVIHLGTRRSLSDT